MKRQWWWNYLLPTNWLLPPPLTQFQSVRKKNRKQRPIYDIAQTICLREFFFFLAYSTLTLATTTPEPKRSASNWVKWFLLVFLYLVWKLVVLLNIGIAINWLIFVCCLFVCVWFEISISKVELHRCTGWISCMRKLERLIRTLKSEQTYVQPLDYLIVCKVIWIFKGKETFYSSAGRGANMFTEKLNVKE